MTLIFVVCKFAKGSFTNERVFKIKRCDEDDYCGTTQFFYCYSNSEASLKPEDASTDKFLSGKLAAKLVCAKIDSDKVTIEVPDGERIIVSKSLVSNSNV